MIIVEKMADFLKNWDGDNENDTLPITVKEMREISSMLAELGRLRDEKTKRLKMQEAIDNLREYAMSLDADIRGTLYYKILELADTYGTHSAGDYFKEAEE